MKKVLIILVVLSVGLGLYYWQAGQSPSSTPPGQDEYVDANLGITFDYDTDNYVVLEQEPDQSNPDLLKTILMMQKVDYLSVINGERAGGEGPPAIILQVYRNPLNQSAQAWAESNAQLSNYQLIMGSSTTKVVTGTQAISYLADGLYASRNVVFAKGDKIYIASGSFLERESALYREFDVFLDSLKIE